MNKWWTVVVDIGVNLLSSWWQKRKQTPPKEDANVDKTP